MRTFAVQTPDLRPLGERALPRGHTDHVCGQLGARRLHNLSTSSSLTQVTHLDIAADLLLKTRTNAKPVKSPATSDSTVKPGIP